MVYYKHYYITTLNQLLLRVITLFINEIPGLFCEVNKYQKNSCILLLRLIARYNECIKILYNINSS